MAYLIQPDYVKYVCSCGQTKPITNLYFCRHCLKIRCGFCICHEVDSHFCANCLENMPSSEARLKKNKCSSCFDCPSCFHTLSTRATMGQPRPSPDPAGGDTKVENKQPKKMYYLSCFNCRWTSRDVGIPDQPVASGGWSERQNPHLTRVKQLLDYYKALAQQEKQEKIDMKYSMRGNYITLTDKTGLTGAMARNLAGLPSMDSTSSTVSNFTPSQATEQVEGLPDDYYKREVNLKQITNMSQRLASPDSQPTSVIDLHPIPRALTVKRSQRCRPCDHNLTKPEYNPGSIKFKIELLAYYHVPEVKIMSCEPLKVGSTSKLLLKLTNPTGYEMQLRFVNTEDIVTEDVNVDRICLDKNEEPVITYPLARKAAFRQGATIAASDVVLVLSQRDDAAEYDEDPQAMQAQHEMVVWRKSNKLVVSLSVSVLEETEEDIIAPLVLEYSYRNTVPPSANQPRQTPDHTLYTTVLLNLGKLVS